MKKMTLSIRNCLRIATIVGAFSGLVACNDDPSPSISLLVKDGIKIDPAGGVGEIRYEIVTPEAGRTVTAGSDADWITGFDCNTEGTILFSYTANSSTTRRTARIDVSYASASYSVWVTQFPYESPYDEDFSATMLTGFYYGDRYSPGMGDYWFFFTDKGFDEDSKALPDGTFYRMDLYAPLSDKTDEITIPEGTYELDPSAEPSCEAFTFSRAMSCYYATDSEGGMADMQLFESGTLTVEATPGGYRLELVVTTAAGMRRAVYEGKVALKNESGSGGGGSGGGSAGEFPALERDVQTDFDRYQAVFLGSYSGISEVNVQFSNMEVDANGNKIPPGEVLDVHFCTVLDEQDQIAEGTYLVGRGEAGRFRPGNALDVGIWAISGTYATVYDEAGHKTVGLVSDGTIDVVRNGDVFDVTLDLEMKGGFRLTGQYSGPLQVGGVSSNSITTLTDDYELDFTQGEIVTTANYWGDFYNTGTGNWTIDISPAEGSRQDDTFITDICCRATGFSDDISGVYTASRNNEASTFMPGYISGQNIMGTMYLGGFDSNGYVTKLAPALSGRVEITANADNTYTITFDCYDDAETPHNFKGSWTGPVRKVDYSEKKNGLSSPRAAADRPMRLHPRTAQTMCPMPEPMYTYLAPVVSNTDMRRF